MTRGRWTALVAVVAFLAAIGGVFVGRVIIPGRHAQTSELHALLHHARTPVAVIPHTVPDTRT